MFLRNGTAYSTEEDLGLAGALNGVPIPRPAFLALLPPARQAYYGQVLSQYFVHDPTRAGTPMEQFMLGGIYAAAGVELEDEEDWQDGIYCVRCEDRWMSWWHSVTENSCMRDLYLPKLWRAQREAAQQLAEGR
ncbi:hypothetical protein B484DRAFT_421215 [Ochromonadaceae sp. CCMP2298]|nr:hypothetical protein B484DRAFT_421215 [Ochromonadaceae sp. CCMP2298]